MINSPETKFSFLGLSVPDLPSWKDSKYVVLPVPYEATVSYGQGTGEGPKAILQASAQVEYFDEELKGEFHNIGIFTAKPVDFAGKRDEEAVALIEKHAGEIFSADKFLLAFGGEHTVSSGIVKAAFQKYPDLHVIHFDAHSDMRDSYKNSKWSHAAVMRRIDDLGIPYTSIGIRAMCGEEYEYIKGRKNKYFFAYEVADNLRWIDEVLKPIKGPVYLTFDVDAFDISVIPHTGTPEPGGLGWYPVLKFLRKLFTSTQVVGADIVELAPDATSRASDFTIAKLAYKMLAYKALVNRASIISH